MAGSVNVVVLVGRLTRDPELRATAGGTSVCALGLAVNDRVKDPNTGEWGERANFFDIDVFGAMGENCARYLTKGREVAIEGRLRYRSWETQDGQKRSAVSVVANNVQFIGPREGGGGVGGYGSQQQPSRAQSGTPFGDEGPRQPPESDTAEVGDEDIPF